MEKIPNEKIEAGHTVYVGDTIYSKEIENLAFRAVEMKNFQEAVRMAKSKLEAIKAVRELLRKCFPEISGLPKPYRLADLASEAEKNRTYNYIVRSGHFGLPPASNEFMIAKNIIDLLSE